eukprot:scaffold22842_cov65-Phaeocystis_antarctica.AAC.3
MLTACASPLRSVDGHALQIDELKGTKPTERINLSHKKLGVASAIIIASCIKENGVLKELKCAAARVFAFLSMPVDSHSFIPVLAAWTVTGSVAPTMTVLARFRVPTPPRASPCSARRSRGAPLPR